MSKQHRSVKSSLKSIFWRGIKKTHPVCKVLQVWMKSDLWKVTAACHLSGFCKVTHNRERNLLFKPLRAGLHASYGLSSSKNIQLNETCFMQNLTRYRYWLHHIFRHKHTFPERNQSVMTPSPPRVKNYSTRWRVGIKKTKKRLGEHGKTQAAFLFLFLFFVFLIMCPCVFTTNILLWSYYGGRRSFTCIFLTLLLFLPTRQLSKHTLH